MKLRVVMRVVVCVFMCVLRSSMLSVSSEEAELEARNEEVW